MPGWHVAANCHRVWSNQWSLAAATARGRSDPVTTPTTPLPVAVERWRARSRYLRWVDALVAWLLLTLAGLTVAPQASTELIVVASTIVVVLGALVAPVRIRWRPVSGWVGLRVSRSLRAGDRAWFVRDGRADHVLITACHAVRVSIALPQLDEAETISVRRTRVFLVPE